MASSATSVLPPVSEALSLLDVSFVNNEWHGTPATIRRSIQILVDHISVQNVQLSRVEDILTSFGNPSNQGGTVWSKLASKADLSRLEKLETQVDGLLNECAQLRTQQNAATHARDDVVARVELMRDQVASLEARLGLPYASDSVTSGHDQFGGARRPGLASGFSSPSKRPQTAVGNLVPSVPTGSILDRITRLERRTDALVEMGAKAEDDSSLLLAKLREMEPRLEVQINHLRGDIKQALALAAASTRLEADAESTTRVKEAEKRLLARIQSVESTLEGKVSAMSAQTGITISTELDKRVNALYDHVDLQVQRLSGDMDRLSRDKIDLTSLEQYSQRISSLFEGVAQGLADEVATLVTQLRAEVAGVARDVEDVRTKQKAAHDNIRCEVDGMRHLSGQVKEAVAAMQEALSTTHNPRVIEDTRAMMRQVMVDTEQLQKAVTGLNSAMSSTSSALELQSHKLGQLSHRLSGLQHDVGSVKDTLYGTSLCTGAANEQDSSAGPSTAGASLLSRLASLDRSVSEVAASLSSKTDDSMTRDMERRVAALARQQDVTAEGLRTLSATAFKRADEHASAIQRLTLAVSGNLEERPTTTAVKHLIETAALEVRERCDNALAPLWDAVRILQSGLRDAAGELKALGSNVSSLQQAQSDSRTKVNTDRASVMNTLRKALEDEVGALRTQLEARIDGIEVGVRQVVEQLELHAQLQDRLTRLTTAVEEQLATQVAAWRAGNQQLRSELGIRADAAAAGLASRVEVLEAASKRHSDDLQALSEASTSKPSDAAVREMANSVSRAVVKQELARHSEKEDAKWQAWLEEQSRNKEHLTTQGNLTAAIESASRQIKQEVDIATTTRVDEVRRAFSSFRGEVDGRLRATSSRVEVVELRVQDLESTIAVCANKKEVEELLASSAGGRTDRAGLEARVRELAEEVEDQATALKVFRAEAVTRSELAAELARKVDLATYLAQGSARAAAASAGALVGGALSPSSPPRRSTKELADIVGRLGSSGAAAAARVAESLQL